MITPQSSFKAIYSIRDKVPDLLCPNPKIQNLELASASTAVWTVSKIDLPNRQLEITFASDSKVHPGFNLDLDCN